MKYLAAQILVNYITLFFFLSPKNWNWEHSTFTFKSFLNYSLPNQIWFHASIGVVYLIMKVLNV